MSNSIIVMAPLANPAGSDTQIQFNNSGVFGADSNLSWNNSGNGVFVVKDFELSFVDGSGHDITIENTYVGGNFLVISGAGNAGGNGGTLTIKGGPNASNNPSRTGGHVVVQGGDSGSTLGSNVSIKGGTATGGNTGDVLIQDITIPKPLESDDGKALTYDHATTSYVLSTISGSSAGVINELQVSDGSGGFVAAAVTITTGVSPGPHIFPTTNADGLLITTQADVGANTGQIDVRTGYANGFDSGNINISTGNVDGGDSGNINIETGTADGVRGNVNINGEGLNLTGSQNVWTLTSTTLEISDTFSFTVSTNAAFNIVNAATVPQIGFFGATPITQPTTSSMAATFSANSSGIVDDTATFDGYTIGQIVAILRQFGLVN